MIPEPALPNAPWINAELYPFRTREHRVAAGTMRFLDEGQGEPVVMVHGNPVWSFAYRKLVAGLRGEYRCLAPDHLGFGQSDKPPDWSYFPEDHAANFASLMEAEGLEGVTLVVNDWGGPIGLSWALAHPERVKRLVILNTWAWPVDDDWYYQGFSGFMGGAVGRWLCRNYNGFVREVVPRAYGDRSRLTAEVHRHYEAALPTPESRKGTWVFPGRIIGSTPWLRGLWEARAALADKPTLLAWGMKDIAFREKELDRWRQQFPAAEVHRFPTAGHYVQEEAGEELVPLLMAFLDRTR
jgi:haloalkane dehalogenase